MDKTFENNTLVKNTANRLDAKQDIFLSPKLLFNYTKSKLRLVPATLAVLVQCAALIFVFLCILVVNFIIPLHFPIFVLVLMQAMLATGFCVMTGMASWWRWIHFCFPIALWGMSMWHVPNDVYLVGFLVSLSLYWTTFRSQVPFYPSRPIVWEKVAELIPSDRAIRMIDIGSGLGGLSMHIAKTRPASQIEGIEIAPLPWLVSRLRAYLTHSNATFKLGDYHQLDFSQYDVVFAYLSPAAMTALWQKAHQEMHLGSMLISYEFEIPDVKPSFCIEGAKQMPAIYVWKM